MKETSENIVTLVGQTKNKADGNSFHMTTAARLLWHCNDNYMYELILKIRISTKEPIMSNLSS